jgi:hypothetical protein
VLRDGDSVRELAVERTVIERSLVKEVRPATRQFSAAVHDGNEIASEAFGVGSIWGQPLFYALAGRAAAFVLVWGREEG